MVEIDEILTNVRTLHAQGEFEGAANLVRKCLKKYTSSSTILECAAWLYTTLGHDIEAIDALRRLSAVSTLSASQNCQLSSLLSKHGNTGEALVFAQMAVEQEPENATVLNQYAGLLIASGDAQKAVHLLLEALKANKTNAAILRQLSVGCEKLGMDELALDFAQHAFNCEPTNEDLLILSSSLLIKARRFKEAAQQMEGALSRAMRHEFIYILLASAYQNIGLREDSLGVIRAGMEALGKTQNLMLHEGIALCSLTRFDEAIEIFNAVIAAQPDNLTARTACVAALTVTGRITEAVGHASYLLSRDPHDQALRNNLKQLMNQLSYSGESGSGAPSNFFAQRKLMRPDGRIARKSSSSLAVQLRIISALAMREARTRFRQSKLSYIWVLFEPLAHIGIMIALINTFAHGPPPLGQSFAVFYFTGIIPYHFFTHTSGYLLSAISGNKSLLLLPTIRPFDVTAARAIVEFANEFAVALIIMLVFMIIGLGSLPLNPLGVFGAFVLIWVAGFGMGMINSVLAIKFHGWDKIWGATASLLYFASGTFYIPSMMPEWIRNILVWNPVLQGIELVRANYFHEVVPRWLDAGYLAFVAGLLFCTGLLMLQASKKQLANV